MHMFFVDIKSFIQGLLFMEWNNKATWHVRSMPGRIWFHAWTPVWHKGNGPYITIGLYFFSISRGY